MSNLGIMPAEPIQDEGPRKHLFMCVWCGGNIEVEDETEAEVVLEALRLHHLECEEMPLRRRLDAAEAAEDVVEAAEKLVQDMHIWDFGKGPETRATIMDRLHTLSMCLRKRRRRLKEVDAGEGEAERLRRRLETIGHLLDDYDEFGHPIQPDGPLPPLAERVHYALGELCQERDEKAQLNEELEKWKHEAKCGHRIMDRVIEEWRCVTGDEGPGRPLVGDAAKEMREMIERLQRQNEVLQLATLRLQCELSAAERVVEAGRHYRNDYGARDLDEALREYDVIK